MSTFSGIFFLFFFIDLQTRVKSVAAVSALLKLVRLTMIYILGRLISFQGLVKILKTQKNFR